MKKTTFVVGQFCFMPHYCGEKGYWARTDRCVAFVGCQLCRAEPGEMCRNDGRPTVTTHACRRRDYQLQKEELEPSRKQATYIIIEELSPVPPMPEENH